MTGTITTYFPDRKYGFIDSEDGVSRFFHAAHYCSGTPMLGETVEFEIGVPFKLGKEKPAVKVKRVAPPADEVAQ